MTLQTRKPERGTSYMWLCGGALSANLLLVLGLLVLLAVNGLSYFWPGEIVLLRKGDGSSFLGEIYQRQEIPKPAGSLEPSLWRTQVKVGNRDLYGFEFVWVDDDQIVSRETPAEALLVERLEFGAFFGYLKELRLASGERISGDDLWNRLGSLLEAKEREREAVADFEAGPIAELNRELESVRLGIRRAELRAGDPADRAARIAELEARRKTALVSFETRGEELRKMRESLRAEIAVLEEVGGKRKELAVSEIVRVTPSNRLGVAGKLGVYASRVREFLLDDPRESNTEGGIFPAIFGTVMMVFLMSFAVVPLGVIAALYLREYAKDGPVVRAVRIAVNNLAGVPSIVFGVFGLGFFVYFLGGAIDSAFFPEFAPAAKFRTGGILWASITLALLTVPVVIVATEEGLAAVPRVVREGSLALGATKFETTWRVVVPAAAPGILTGLILAMARAAGEVAPLMIVGMVKLAPAMPISGEPPFVHLDRKFMHLGFHIYDVGFQSPNVEASKPLVFATAFLLVVVVTVMNLVAIWIRTRLRRKYAGAAV